MSNPYCRSNDHYQLLSLFLPLPLLDILKVYPYFFRAAIEEEKK